MAPFLRPTKRMSSIDEFPTQKPKQLHPFRRAVLRGFGIVLPPILTIVIFAWVGQTVSQYVLTPVENGARDVIAIVMYQRNTLQEIPDAAEGDETAMVGDRPYRRLGSGEWIPLFVYDRVVDSIRGEPLPKSSFEYYRRYVKIRYLQPYVVIPVFLCVFILLMYLLGKFLAAGIGRVVWNSLEKMIHRLPLIRNVYSSVKQVTDFVFQESEIQYTRVVAIEYPRKGVWSFGLVTSDSLLDIRVAANEPVLAVLIPSSPMPVTGYTITVKKSECVDLNISIDQAFQFIVSCGVVVPPQQLQTAFDAKRAAEAANPQLADNRLENTK